MTGDEHRVGALRRFFAGYVAAAGGATDPRIERAFAAIPREPFAGPGPWSIKLPGHDYLRTPNDDPAFLYQDTLIALDAARGINIGHPSSHAMWLDALALREGETVLQVGVGTGYYTAILAHLAGPAGRVHGFEIDHGLAARATRNLRATPQVAIHARSGLAGDLPKSDAIYVNAGLTQPSPGWLDALNPGGRLLFPLQAAEGRGGMLRIDRPAHGTVWPARFVSPAAFIPCVGEQDPEIGRRLAAAFRERRRDEVKSVHVGGPPDDTCWLDGDGWWLSTAPPA